MDFLNDNANSYRINNNISDNNDCSFILQDSKMTLNSGFWLIRNSSKGRDLLEGWINNFEYHESKISLKWNHEQGALNNYVLQLASAERLKIDNSTHNYTYECNYFGRSGQMNACFQKYMSEFNYEYGKRFINGICMIPPTGIPNSFHLQYQESPGLFTYHCKINDKSKCNKVNQLNKSWKKYSTYLRYDKTLKKIKLYNNTFVSKDARIFWLFSNNELHYIPNMDTFNYLNKNVIDKERARIVIVDETYINSIKIGSDVPTEDF